MFLVPFSTSCTVVRIFGFSVTPALTSPCPVLVYKQLCFFALGVYIIICVFELQPSEVLVSVNSRTRQTSLRRDALHWDEAVNWPGHSPRCLDAGAGVRGAGVRRRRRHLHACGCDWLSDALFA